MMSGAIHLFHSDVTRIAQSPGGHSITKHTGGWLEGLNKKTQHIHPKIATLQKC